MKIVHNSNEWSVIRSEYYGFGCNKLSVAWDIHFRGEFYSRALTLKAAKKLIEYNMNLM